MPNHDKRLQMATKSADSRFTGSRAGKKHLSRQRRQRVNRVLRELPYDEDSWLDCEDELEHDSQHRSRMYWLRGDRQSSANFAPLYRWAEDLTRDMDAADRAAFVVSRLPQGKRGWSARDAVYHHLRYDIRWADYDPMKWKHERKQRETLEFLEVVELIERIIAEHRLKAFNSVVYSNGPPVWYTNEYVRTSTGHLRQFKVKHVGEEPRILQDKRDIVPFLEHVFGRHTGQLERERMLTYLLQVYGYEPS